MHADAVDRGRQMPAGDADQRPRLQHPLHVRPAGLGAMQHRAGLRTRHELAVVLVRPVREHLQRHPQTSALASPGQCRVGRGQQDQVPVQGPHRPRHGFRQRRIRASHVAQRAMGLHVRHPAPFRRRHALQRADLVDQPCLQFRRRQVHAAPAEALQIGKRRVRAEADPARQRRTHGLAHHQRVTGMEAAGDVRAGHHIEHGGVVAHRPGAEAFAEVGVEVDRVQGHRHLRQVQGSARSMPLTRLPW